MDKTSIVIGGSGFLGKVVVAGLKHAGHTVINIDKRKTETAADKFIEADLRSPTAEMESALLEADYIVHLAAHQFNKDIPKWKENEYFFSTNVKGTEEILKIAVPSKQLKHFLFVSTDMTYGIPQNSPITENHPTNPLGYYGRSKREAEKLIEGYMEGKANWTIFRPRLILGPGRLGVMIKLFKLINSNKSVPVIGQGNTRYQMASVFDVAKGIELAIEKGKSGYYNLGSDNPPKVKDLLQGLIVAAGSKSKLLHLPQRLATFGLDLLFAIRMSPLFPEQYKIASVDYLLDTSKAKKELGWLPEYSDQQMISEAYEYYLDLEKKSK
jgi:dTDP-glucose 4,6-dehydratase